MKILVVTATAMEMETVHREIPAKDGIQPFVCGAGPVEAAVNLAAFLARPRQSFDCLILGGVAGAYCGAGAEILDICLAEQEVLGDFGICVAGRIDDFDSRVMRPRQEFFLDISLRREAESILRRNDFSFKIGRFVTVNCATGSLQRGNFLRDRHGALCENMEGAAVARVCEEFNLPCLESRCVSNMVEDRDPSGWRLAEACRKSAEAVALLAATLAADGR